MFTVKYLLTLTSITIVSCSTSEHGFIFKRFHRGLLECAEILNIPKTTVQKSIEDQFRCNDQTKLLIHCVMVQLHTWSDGTGLRRSALVQFFEPTAYEALFEPRTDMCLTENLAYVDKCDFVTRAYVTFDCFYKQYGNLARNVHAVILNQKQLISALNVCFAIADIPQEAIQRLTVENVLEVPEAHCLLYIFSLRAGLYNEVGGVLMDSIYSQFGNRTLTQSGKITCVQHLLETSRFADRCSMLNAVYDRCLFDAIPINELIVEAAKHALANVGR
ncbi:AAEL008640-PA [Aedes aegypti]|uniref:AAEL008640-PA n=1 Tax=Aedes aegypti TaxID=7159 RepID=Q16Y73_AEDAE|nr:AAEL008640-PA [Aedes aegypti]